MYNRENIVKQLLKNGKDIDIYLTNSENLNALQIAKERQSWEVLRILQEYYKN